MLQGGSGGDGIELAARRLMKPYLHRGLVAAACAVALANGAAHAAGENPDKHERAEERTDGRAARKGKRASPSREPSRFETCRRDAKGKEGPERASFMTECLHERR